MLRRIVDPPAGAPPPRTWRVFVDGACNGNHQSDRAARSAGYGIWFESNQWQRSGSVPEPFTNNRAELFAMIVLLENVLVGCTPVQQGDALHVIGDNRYVLDSITQWIEQWKARGWLTSCGDPVKNQELMMRLDRAVQVFRRERRPLTLQWTRAHTREPADKSGEAWLNWHGNDKADKLARRAAAEDDKERVCCGNGKRVR